MLIPVTGAVSILDYLLKTLHGTWHVAHSYLPEQCALFSFRPVKPQMQFIFTRKGLQTGCLLSRGAPSTFGGFTIITVQGL